MQEEKDSDPDCPMSIYMGGEPVDRKCGDVTDSVDQTILRRFPDWTDRCSADGKDTQSIHQTLL